MAPIQYLLPSEKLRFGQGQRTCIWPFKQLREECECALTSQVFDDFNIRIIDTSIQFATNGREVVMADIGEHTVLCQVRIEAFDNPIHH